MRAADACTLSRTRLRGQSCPRRSRVRDAVACPRLRPTRVAAACARRFLCPSPRTWPSVSQNLAFWETKEQEQEQEEKRRRRRRRRFCVLVRGA